MDQFLKSPQIFFVDLMAIVVQMQIFIKSHNGKLYLLRGESSDTILNVKKKIFDKEDIPVHQQWLVCGAKPLQDNLTLADYNIREGSTIFVCHRHLWN
jgi:ubiquitin-large subunit ribosomal protein L40e